MALNHHTCPAAQTISEPLKTGHRTHRSTWNTADGKQHGLDPWTDWVQRLQEVDSAMILSQQQGYKLLNEKNVIDDSA